jgi:hypothetical protein
MEELRRPIPTQAAKAKNKQTQSWSGKKNKKNKEKRRVIVSSEFANGGQESRARAGVWCHCIVRGRDW